MTDRLRASICLSCSLVICLICFVIGITWGLPSRASDAFLFGEHPIWDGATIQNLAPGRTNASLGADVDPNPISNRISAVVLNSTDAQRAEIVRRYRLYTAQPDEMITLMALASMKPAVHDLDPKLYQYGGLWIYPVGALLKLASVFHWIDLTKPQTFYLDHPEVFARFYVIARLYCVGWALIGAAAVFALMMRWTREPLIAAATTMTYGLMPVVVNMAHEAKPHLPAAALMLWSIYFAARYVDTGLRRWWVAVGLASGGAAALVLSAMPALLVPVAMVLMRKESTGQKIIVLVASFLIAIDLYLLTNPYVLIHAMRDRTVLLSNLHNSQAMYQAPPSIGGLRNAIKLILAGASPIVAVGGVVGLIGLARKREPAAIALIVLALIVFTQFAVFATDKPAEFARFALFPDIALAMAAFAGVAKLRPNHWFRWPIIGVLLVSAGMCGSGYIWHFGRDATARPTRTIVAERMRELSQEGSRSLALAAEPAPYSMPPVDLWKWKLILAPPGELLDCGVDATLRTVDHPNIKSTLSENGYILRDWIRPRLFDTPISWAAKPFEIGERLRPQKLYVSPAIRARTP